MGVEVDHHPAINREVVCVLGSLNVGRQGAAVVTITIVALVSSSLSSNVPNVSSGTELGKFKFNIVENKFSEAMVGVTGLT